MKKDIILIGPVGVGKSTIGKILASKLNIPQCSMDEVRWEIYEEIDYDYKLAQEITNTNGFLGIYKYWKPFEAYSVRRVLELYSGCVHDFGAGHSVYEDPKLLEEVKDSLKDYPNVVLLLPSPNREITKQVLFKRVEFPFNDLFIYNNSNEQLAKIVIYTEGKTLEEICNEILKKVNL